MASSGNSNKWEKFKEELDKDQSKVPSSSQNKKPEETLDQERFKSFIVDIKSIPNLNR